MTTATPALEPPARPTHRARTWLLRICGVLAGLSVGLVIAEVAFRTRDHGAFPHLNVYVADPELGVRLMPGAEEDVSFGGNPVTHVRINRAGYRGTELAAPSADEVLVVGDSQVFGLGVEEDETFAHGLAVALKRTVVNAGVPTYGPGEYRAVIAEQLAARHPKTVIVGINLVNDLFELQHPNKDRHAVWDGWAVRKELAPASTTWFPGRDLVYRRSHLFFALRKWLHESDDKLGDAGVPSEGTWEDAVTTGRQLSAAHAKTADDKAKHALQLAALQKALSADDAKLDELLGNENFSDIVYSPRSSAIDPSSLATLPGARANPGDIVYDNYGGEEARPVAATAEQIRQAAAAREQMRARVVAWAKKHKGKLAGSVLSTDADLADKAQQLEAADAQRIAEILEPPLAPYLRDVSQLVTADGARLVVLVLPIDVQVSADEWKKYGHAPIDMAPSRALAKEIADWCAAQGITALDATAVLAAAEPGAFLDHDIHMTPKGHAAVAAALAKAIATPPPVPALRSERSPVPVPAIWRAATEVIVPGSSDARCETKKVREWLRIQCARSMDAYPYAVSVTKDDGRESFALAMPNEVSLLVPVVEGHDFTATVTWTNGTRDVHVGWPTGGKPVQTIGRLVPAKAAKELDPYWYDMLSPKTYKFASPVEQELCRCWQVTFGGSDVEYYDRDTGEHGPKVPSCSGIYGSADPSCIAPLDDQPRSCEDELRCMWRAL